MKNKDVQKNENQVKHPTADTCKAQPKVLMFELAAKQEIYATKAFPSSHQALLPDFCHIALRLLITL